MPRAHVHFFSRSFASALVGGVVFALLLAASIAHAEDDSREGSYAGVGYGYAFENFDENRLRNVDDASGVNVWMGYRFNDIVAVETQIEYQNGFDAADAVTDGDGQYVVGTLNVKVYPLAHVLPDRIDPFVYVGIGAGHLEITLGAIDDVEEIAFLARFGGGIDIYITENVALQISASHVQPVMDLRNYSYTSTVAGVQFRF